MLPVKPVQHFLMLSIEERISKLVSAIIDQFKAHQLSLAFAVAISGIAVAGKGFISERVIEY